MSSAGFDVPKVQVSVENDMALKPPGKLCARSGLPHLPGGLMRSYSSPMALTCPGGWLDEHQQRLGSRGREFKDRQRETSTLSNSMASGEWGVRTATLRPGTSAPVIMAPGGGNTQGAKHIRPHTRDVTFTATGDRPGSSARWRTGAPGFSYGDPRAYNREKHGWHDPRGQAEHQRLRDPSEPGSWAWTMRKARDHVGYGDDGVVNWGDIQISAVSGDGPDWFVGTRTVPGPFNTKYVPVRRCPQVEIQGRNVLVKAKTYKQGPGLDTVETLHDSHKPPTPAKVDRPPTLREKMSLEADHPAKKNNIVMGGCQIVPPGLPPSKHRFEETYEHGLRRRF